MKYLTKSKGRYTKSHVEGDDFVYSMLKVIISENTDLSSLEINAQTSLENLTAIEMSNIIIDIEDEFKVRFSTSFVRVIHMKTIEDLKNHVDHLLDTKAMA